LYDYTHSTANTMDPNYVHSVQPGRGSKCTLYNVVEYNYVLKFTSITKGL